MRQAPAVIEKERKPVMGKLIVTNTSVLLPDMTIARGQTVETENGIISAIRIRKEKK